MSTFDQRLREAYDYGVATAHTTPACRDYLFDQWRDRLAGLDPLDAIPTPPAGNGKTAVSPLVCPVTAPAGLSSARHASWTTWTRATPPRRLTAPPPPSSSPSSAARPNGPPPGSFS